MLEWLRSLDEALFFIINNQLATPLLDGVMTLFTVVGDSGVWIGFGILTILFSSPLGGRKRRLITFFLVMSIAGIALNVGKEIVLRKRPLHRFKQEIKQGTVEVKTPYTMLVSRSFPSGHSQAAFSAATFFALYYRRYRFALYGAAAMVALSRVYLGVHFPADIIVGSLLGWFISWMIWQVDPLTSRYRSRTVT